MRFAITPEPCRGRDTEEAIPRDQIHIVPVPDVLVQIDPGWSGSLYFVYEDEVVIVDPSDMEIVAILPV